MTKRQAPQPAIITPQLQIAIDYGEAKTANAIMKIIIKHATNIEAIGATPEALVLCRAVIMGILTDLEENYGKAPANK